MTDKVFTVECETIGREVYRIEADSEAEARQLFEGHPEAYVPTVSEVTSMEGITAITEEH